MVSNTKAHYITELVLHMTNMERSKTF